MLFLLEHSDITKSFLEKTSIFFYLIKHTKLNISQNAGKPGAAVSFCGALYCLYFLCVKKYKLPVNKYMKKKVEILQHRTINILLS